MVTLFASDLDGTFLETPFSASERNVTALRLCDEREVPFIFATGRPSRWLNHLQFLRVGHPLAITSNGAAIIDLAEGRVLEQFCCDVDVVRDVAADVRRTVPDALFMLEYGTWCGAEMGVPPSDFLDDEILNGDFDAFLKRDRHLHKLLVRSESTPTEELYAAVAPIVNERLCVTYSYLSAIGVLELSAPGVSKASTLSRLCTDLGVAQADVAAFGDMPNDLEMLTWAGQGFAMPDAHALLRGGGIVRLRGKQTDAVGRTVEALLG